ncbi:SDR family NAD(P)-dependent oxidoreductase [Pararhodonellum marinum]|uniref:SDR family NAD(P)-dependent oxidoreductase n=1 Tax=Pararhodonellum marinum TaxID=2755358 RepID=UPI00188FADC5|nr:SDR family NAD(P)-dependent oxidoreductase [Pararhodonellum marinum]
MANKQYTLITGASMGIGKAFAFECAARGQDILLVALPEALLKTTQQQIKARYPVEVNIYGTDLTQPTAIEDLYQHCIQNNFYIHILINNVGMGMGGRFENISPEIYRTMLNLNTQVMTMMTYYFLPMLKTSPKAYILNMSSMEATLPLPYKSVYTGTKNYIYAFSLALREELATMGIQVAVLCPGPVLTNEEGLKRMSAHGKRAKWVMLMPEEVAKIGIDNLMKGKGVIVPGKINWTIVKLMKLFPTSVKMKLLERIFRVYESH